jgi:hypothetical protein
MKTLPIADCRLPINRSFAGCRLTRGCHDGGQGVGFFQQRGQFFRRHDAGLNQQFEPQGGFVRLFLDRPNFRDEFSLTAGAATGAIVRRHRSAAANDLFGDDTAGIVIFGNCASQFDDPQREGFGACFQLGRIHGLKLQTQSAIGNRQSAIKR